MPPQPDPNEIETVLLGGAARYTREEAIARSGAGDEFARRIWRALGFAAREDNVATFTDGDVEALRIASSLLELEIIDTETAVRLARAMGQTLSRLADWQVNILAGLSQGGSGTESQIGPLPARAKELLPAVETLLVHVWRRQLAAATTRALAALESTEDATAPNYYPMVVGFADLVSFTNRSRELDELRLAELVEEFEAASSDIVATCGGRLIKTLGDEILYVADDAEASAEIALRLAAGIKTPAGVPDIRVGVAYGPVLAMMGDVFGTTVNRASRLTSFAQPGTVLTDEGIARRLEADARYQLVGVRPRHAHGLGQIKPYVLRHAAE